MIPDSSDDVIKVAEEAKSIAEKNGFSEIQPIHLFVGFFTKSKLGKELIPDFDFPETLLKTQLIEDSSTNGKLDFSIPSKQLINRARGFCVMLDFDELTCFGFLMGFMACIELMPVFSEAGVDIGKVWETANSKGKDYLESIG